MTTYQIKRFYWRDQYEVRAKLSTGGQWTVYWMATVEHPEDNSWTSGWIFLPDMVSAGLLVDGPTIPGTYGDNAVWLAEHVVAQCPTETMEA